MKETDLRVIKTREAIEQAFLSLLERKPLSRITVTELAREARINKGTFYLHYSDLTDLYRKTVRRHMTATFENADYFHCFFDDPPKFCRSLTDTFSSTLPTMRVLVQDLFSHYMTSETLNAIREKIYQTGRIKRCVMNDIRLDALFGGLLVCRPRYEAEHCREMDRYMLSAISDFHADQTEDMQGREV